jgi:hypothetical protein
MATWGALLASLLTALLDAFFRGHQAATDSVTRDQTNGNLGAADAANETLSTIADIAAERADLPAAPDADADLVASLRARASADRKSGASIPATGNAGKAG